MNKNKLPLLSAIVAMAENRVIGQNNQLPWRLPADLKHFKTITTGHPILMGRKTYESIGRPLPDRTNIVITRNAHYCATGCLIVTSLQAALEQAAHNQCNEIFIIGGAEVYSQAMPALQRIYLTVVHHDFAGDAYFPTLNKQEWKEIDRENHLADKDNPYPYSFLKLERTLTT